MADATLAALRERLNSFHALTKAADVLEWDQDVMMPRAGAASRSLQIGAVRRAAHEALADAETGRLIDALSRRLSDPDDESDDAALWRWARHEFERRRREPAAQVEELARATSRAQDVWAEARAKADFALFRPELERVVALKRRQAETVGGAGDPYDAWLEEFEPGMTTADVDRLFAELEPGLVPLARAAAARGPSPLPEALRGRFDLGRQRELAEAAARLMGFDFAHGRLDESAHPFSTAFSLGDVRLTTRYRETDLFSALFGVMHEAGHGLYEQRVDAALAETPLCRGATMALHESQSRLWENVVGRGRPFWTAFLPRLHALFPQTASLGIEEILAAVNRSAPSLIRVEADELTYSLHVLLRYDLERRLLSGKLKVAELPDAWNEGMRVRIGLTPHDDASGVLQDVHWSAGLFGYFPTYAIGNMISVQLYSAAVAASPEIPGCLSRGDCAPLLGWLSRNVHRHGRKFSAQQIVRCAAGEPISAAPYLTYLRGKYGAELRGRDGRS
jgi:carboxypeptidase Taq